MTAVSVGASSRQNESETTRGMYSIPPKRRRPKANWIVMTMPMKTDVTVTMPIERTPSDSSCWIVELISNGRRKSDFAVWDDLTRIPGVILERRRAEEIYENLKQQAIDPGLLQQGEGDSAEARTWVLVRDGTVLRQEARLHDDELILERTSN